MCPYVWFSASSSALSLHSHALTHSARYYGAFKSATPQVRVKVWRCLTLLPHEEESLMWHYHSCRPHLTCPHGVRRRGTGLTTGTNPSWSSTHDSTPAEELILEGHQSLPSSHPGHNVFSVQHSPSWYLASLIACSSTSSWLIFPEQQHHQ